VSNPAPAALKTTMAPLNGGDQRLAGPDTATRPQGVHSLTEQKCTELLALATVGRVGFVTPQGLQIIPVNVRLTGASLRLDTTPNSSLSQLAEMSRDVTLEIDEYAADTGQGWSVLMQGKLGKLDRQAALRPNPVPQAEARPGDLRTQALEFTPRSYSGRLVQHEPRQDSSEQPATDRSTPDGEETAS
jgi:hypothetical protein